MSVSARIPTRPKPNIFDTLLKISPVYYALLIIFIVAALSEEAFLQMRTMRNILVNSTALGLISVGQTAVILSAGIDLSVGPVVSLMTVIAAVLMETEVVQANPSYIFGIVLLCLAGGITIGLVNGLAVAYLRMNPFILTLATGTIVQGIALQVLYQPGGLVTRGFREVALGSLFSIPYPVFYLLGLYLIGSIILKRTSYGLSIYAVGGNELSARLSGIRTRQVKLSLYVISGFLAACAGLYLAARIGSGDPNVGTNFTLDSITATVLGGTSLFGGVGNLWGSLTGVLVLGMLNSALNLNNVSAFYQWIFKGLILIGALAVNFWRKRG